jgi:vacuole morphology and inheritance protein 14
MLSDSSHEIRQQADSALSEFLQEIKNSPVRLLLIFPFLIDFVTFQCQILTFCHYPCFFLFICHFLTQAVLLLKSVDYGRMAEILVQRAGSGDEFTRLTAITWVTVTSIL